MLIPAVALFILAGASSSASAVYRCQHGSAVTYSDSPCASGTASDISDRVRDRVTPADAEEARQRLARQQQYLGQANAQQLKEQQAADRSRKIELRSKAARDKRCAELALRRKWAQEDAELANMKAKASAQRKAARAVERYDLACKT